MATLGMAAVDIMPQRLKFDKSFDMNIPAREEWSEQVWLFQKKCFGAFNDESKTESTSGAGV